MCRDHLGPHRPSAGDAQNEEGLRRPPRPSRLWGSRRSTGGCGSGGGVGVNRVGLALIAAGLAVGTVDLDHPESGGGEGPGKPCAVGAGAFDPDAGHRPERGDPGHEGAVAGRCRREAPVVEVATQRVDHGGDVSISMGVDPGGTSRTSTLDGRSATMVIAASRCAERVGSTRQQPVDKTVMGACSRRLL